MKNIRAFFYILLTLLLDLILSPNISVAQGKQDNSRELFFAKGHNRFAAGVYLSKGWIDREYGDVNLESKLGFGFNFTWIHTKQISNKWGIEWGLGGGILPWTYFFDLEDGTIDKPSLIMYGTEYTDYLYAPLQAVFRKPLKHNLYLNIRSGISMRYIVLQGLSLGVSRRDEDGDVTRIFRSNSEFDNIPRVNFNLGLGISWVLPYFDMLDFQLMANISPRQYIFNDYYFFPEAVDETFGHYRSRGTYVGIQVAYVFTKVRKILKRGLSTG